MKPVSVKVTTKEVTASFDDGREILFANIEEGEQDFAIDYLSNVMGISQFQKTNGSTFVGAVEVDMSTADWATASAAHRRHASRNDALLFTEMDSDFPAEYLNRIKVELRLAEGMAGIFEDLANGY